MEYSVYGCFPDRHCDSKDFVFLNASLLGHLFGGFLNFVYTVQRGLERVSNTLSGQLLFLAFFHIFRLQNLKRSR